MRIIEGKYNSAKVFTDVIEETAIKQIETLCNQEFVADSNIRIMPDVHAGAGCTIGFTMTITDKICPNLVGVDIGCGMRTIYLGDVDIDFKELDEIIKNHIPNGRNVQDEIIYNFDLSKLKCYKKLNKIERLEKSIGTLGGGNHFIEIDIDEKNNDKYLVIHSGSRNLGFQVAKLYQNIAVASCNGKDINKEQEKLVQKLKEECRNSEIQNKIKELRKNYSELLVSIPKDLCYLSGEYKDNYLHDMKICQEFAVENRRIMAEITLNKLHLEILDEFETIHNYINFDDNILRKGAMQIKKKDC